MGKVISLNSYLERIKYPNNLKLLEDFKGQNTSASFIFKECGCIINSNIKQITLLKNFDKCVKCRPKASLDRYLKDLDFDVKLLEPYKGGKTKCSILKKCNHEYETILERIKYSNVQVCFLCKNRFPLDYYLNILPKNSFKIIEKYIGSKTKVEFTYSCGHIKKTTLYSLVNECKNYDNCNSCLKKQTKENLLKHIPKQYIPFIIFKNNKGFYSDIIYKNPCGHDSESKLGSFVERKQFDFCLTCYNESTKKNVYDYIKTFDENLNIKLLKKDGRNSIVKFKCSNCNNESEVKLSSLLSTNGKSCSKCDAYNKLSENDMRKALSDFVDVESFSESNGKYIASRNTIIYGKCKNCNHIINDNFFNLSAYYKIHKKSQCKNCAPKNIIQKSIYDFVKSIEDDAIYDCRTEIKYESTHNKEIDIFCPSKRVGIEYNGLIWHSEKYKNDIQYHVKKSKACADVGINLIHIWGDKYLKKSEIYHSIIKAKLGKIDNRIYARQTEIKELSKSELKNFFQDNHLDGSVGCITGWGLFYKNELVQAISVRKVNSQNKKYKNFLEIARMSSKVNTLVVGGESKLLSVVERYANQQYKGLLNYVSSDFGRLTKKKWKFELDGYTSVSYFYTDGNKRISRQKLQSRPKDISEKEYAKKLGLLRVNANDNMIYVLRF